MGLRQRLGGEWCWTRVGSVLMSLLGRMGWGYGIILGGARESSQVIPDLRWEIALRLVFGMICGVGI
jgi:hypothetical protein